MKALIIDDSRVTRSILKGMLEEHNFQTLEAADGREAIEQIKQHPDVKLALVDWNMPVMNGYEFICDIRADEKYNDCFLMMVTTETEMEQVVKALQAGANEYVMKPFTKDIIKEKLKILGILD